MSTGLTRVIEDYLVTIYRLEKKYGVAKTSDIARLLKVSLGTVTNNLVRLKALSLVEHLPYKGIRLTKKGREIALGVIKRHRLAERLLTDVLGVEWYKTHEIAHKLEHDMEGLESHLEKALGNPERCPHGNPISENISTSGIKLSEASERRAYKVISVDLEETSLLEYLEELQLKPGTLLKVLLINDTISVELGEKIVELPRLIASRVIVREVRENV